MCVLMILMNRNIITLFCGITVLCLMVYSLWTSRMDVTLVFIFNMLTSQLTQYSTWSIMKPCDNSQEMSKAMFLEESF